MRDRPDLRQYLAIRLDNAIGLTLVDKTSSAADNILLLPEGDLLGELLELQVLARTGELDAYRPPLYLGFPGGTRSGRDRFGHLSLAVR